MADLEKSYTSGQSGWSYCIWSRVILSLIQKCVMLGMFSLLAWGKFFPTFFPPFPSSSSIPIHCGDPGTHWLGQEPKYKSFGTKSWFKFEVWRKMWNYTRINRSVKTFLLSKTWKSEKDETGKCVKQHSSDTQASGRSNLTAHICDNSQE